MATRAVYIGYVLVPTGCMVRVCKSLKFVYTHPWVRIIALPDLTQDKEFCAYTPYGEIN